MDAHEFGPMLRHRRDRLPPAAVGLPHGGRRRAVGLRREELAALTGISSDYLTRLEQGRAVSPSEQVVQALARALRLEDDDRELFFRLAGHHVPGPDVVPSHIPPSVQRLLDRLAHTPVAVFDAAMTLVSANAPYDALMGDSTRLHGRERNAVLRNLIGSGNRAVTTQAEKDGLDSRLVAELRHTAARYPTDRDLRALVDELHARSARFAELWESSEALPPREPSRHKVIDHPTVGRITLDCDTLVVAADDLRIMIYTAEPGTHDAELLSLAIVVGTQSFAE